MISQLLVVFQWQQIIGINKQRNEVESLFVAVFQLPTFSFSSLYQCFLTPGEYGIPRPWYFVFQINYWGGIPLEAGMPIPPAPTDQDEGTKSCWTSTVLRKNLI